MIKKMLLSAVVPVLLAAGVPTDAKASGGFNLGSIVCKKADNENGQSYFFFSYQEVDCVYYGVGGTQKYDGVQGILFGVDIGTHYSDVMTYEVVGGSWDSKNPLEGAYAGVQASAIIGIGPTVQGGLFGAGNGVSLLPLGLGGAFGVGVSGGLSYLTLTAIK